jgi:hypothetical protein
MKFDLHEWDVLAKVRPAAPPRSADWRSPGSRGVGLVELIALACIAVYFLAAAVGIFLA